MTSENTEADKRPTTDPAENNAFFPSPYSLGQFTSAKSDLAGADYPNPYREGKWKVLIIATDERYLLMQNGTMFSTGNHPVEMLLPMYHMNKAGFDFDVATLSGNPVKLELWALPKAARLLLAGFFEVIKKFLRCIKAGTMSTNDGAGFVHRRPRLSVWNLKFDRQRLLDHHPFKESRTASDTDKPIAAKASVAWVLISLSTRT